MTKKEQVAQFAQNLRGNTELTGLQAETLRDYFTDCEELKALQDRVNARKPVAIDIVKQFGSDTNNPKVKAGNTQVGVAIRRHNEVVLVTLTETQGSEVVEWQKVAEHLAKALGIEDLREFAERNGYTTHRSGTKTLAINDSARTRKATSK